MDKLTLEYFTNKQTYNKYLAKKDPNRYNENEARTSFIDENKESLKDIFSKLLDDSSCDELHILKQKYIVFVDACIEHVQNVKTTKEQIESEYYEREDDTIFTKFENASNAPINPIEYWKMQTVLKNDNIPK